MFRKFNFQPSVLVQDAASQLNWQTITDNTKSSGYTPVLTNITGTGVTTSGYYSYYGPWVLVSIYVTTSSGNFTTAVGNGFITLPTPVLVGTTSAVPQYMVITRADNTLISGILTNTNASNTTGQIQINNSFYSNITTLLYISGVYLRN
jgi:hypothetical protein